jgi:iron complex outermembrane receptor protein
MNKSRLSSTYPLTHRLPVLLVALTLPLHAVVAQEAKAAKDTVELSDVDVVEDSLQILPRDPIGSVFGFGKSVLETPRGVTSISNELMNNVTITEIDDLVAMSPGSFTQSFFGVAGSLDVRGTAGENYFRGVRRIENPGNYPQAIGASDRIDIVRGPASPIYGPSKIGGYLNFVPKSARASTGQYLKDPQGEMGITTGSWGKKVLHAEVGGPGEIGGKQLGYYLYGESENSGSYYENTSTIQSILQASFDMNLTDHLRTEFGGMFQNFKGNQVAGWNRVTQDLIDHGTYVTGSPISKDTNGDGLLSRAESNANGGLSGTFFGPTVSLSPAAAANMALQNPGTAHIDGSQVLVQEDDTLEDKVVTLYGDFIYEVPDVIKVTNKSFYESLNNLNENAYGFSQFAKTYVFEDQLIFEFSKRMDKFAANIQIGPSIRYQNFEHGDDFANEYYDRRDITKPGSPIDRRTLATRGQELYNNHSKGHYTDSAVAFLADLTWFDKLNLLGGARYDNIQMSSRGLFDATTSPGVSANDTKGATSWSASLSYQLPFGLRPYVTTSKQSTLITGQGGQLEPSAIATNTAVADSKLTEYGIKATLIKGHLYIAADHYKQERVDLQAADLVTNNTTRGEGTEVEFTWVVVPQLSLIGAYTNSKVINLTALQNGQQFWFFGAADIPGFTPAQLAGGVVLGNIYNGKTSEDSARKAGIPENVYSLNAIINMNQWLSGVTASVGATHASEVYSGFARHIKLPAYTLVNVGLHYEKNRWKAGLQVKNLTDERYFRSNFPDLYGDNIVLPELPRNYVVTLGYKF